MAVDRAVLQSFFLIIILIKWKYQPKECSGPSFHNLENLLETFVHLKNAENIKNAKNTKKAKRQKMQKNTKKAKRQKMQKNKNKKNAKITLLLVWSSLSLSLSSSSSSTSSTLSSSSRSSSMQNLEAVAWKLTELWPIWFRSKKGRYRQTHWQISPLYSSEIYIYPQVIIQSKIIFVQSSKFREYHN